MKYGVIGDRLSHSRSPEIHHALGNTEYDKLELDEKELAKFLDAREFSGINVTIPYKKAVIPYCDIISPQAGEIGSVNTLYLKNGKLYADNTDAYGMRYMLERASIEISGKKVLILGSGGTSLTAQYVAKEMGASDIIVVSRKGPVTYGDLGRHSDSEVIINTTPLGMYPDTGKSAVELKMFPECRGVADVVYNPLRTRLILEAGRLGIPCTGGLPMLVAQAKRAHELFFDTIVPDDLIEKILNKLEMSMSNIVLIGMPGCGKTTIGRNLAKKTGREFYDIDHQIQKECGMTPAELIVAYGEDYFRDVEQRVTSQVCKKSGCVISAGGGTVIREANRDSVKQNGRVVYLMRPLCELSKSGRPLSSGDGALERLFKVRDPIYRATADYYIDISGEADHMSRKIIDMLDIKTD